MTDDRYIKDLGYIDEKLLFFGGVYSNFQALTELKKYAEANGYLPVNIFCTGDIAGYCAQPNECIELIQQWGINAIAGNVELQLRNAEDDCGCGFSADSRCDLFSRNWYDYTKSKITALSIEYLNTLPHHFCFGYGNDRIMLVHGSWFHTS